jgi:release factor glutamine methyltransferase
MSPAEDGEPARSADAGAPAIRSLAGAQTIGEALRLATAALRASGATDTPELDAQVLLAHVSAAARATLLAYPERELPQAQAARFAELVARRLNSEPVAYLTGHREFMGLDFLTDQRALIPRPETELLVEAALRDIRERLDAPISAPPIVADIGTGSGAIALALAVHEPRLPRVYATDISPDALALAATNADRLGVAERVTLLHGDLLDPLPEQVDILIANLPDVAPREAGGMPPDVRLYEPSLALYGDEDGLGHLRRLFAQTPAHLRAGGSLYLEFGFDQRAAVEALARATLPGAALRIGTDYAGWDRYIMARSHGHPGL